jgi:putative aldouronate transport system substrate-binding protein
MKKMEKIPASLKVLLAAFMVLSLSTVLFAGGRGQAAQTGVKSLHALVPNQGFDMNDGVANPVHLFIQEKTGYTITYDQLPMDEPMNKLNAIMAAGAQEYDFVSLYGEVKDRYAQYASQGALMDMAPLVKGAPNLAAGITQEMIDVVTIGDTYYCIPGLSASARPGISSTPDNFLLIRTDLMKKIGRTTLPTTLSDFTAMLQAYKDQDPMKAGSANVPLVVDIGGLNNLRRNSLGGAFGIELDWKDEGGTLVPYQTQTGFFEYLQYLNDLYRRGLMDPEMPTNNGATVREKFTTNKALVRPDGWWDIPSLRTTFQASYPEASVEFIQPLERNGMAGAQVKSAYQVHIFTFIPKGAKNYLAVMDFLNKKAEPAIYKESVIGREGVDHTVNAQGGYEPITPVFFESRGNADKYQFHAPAVYGEYWLARAKKDADQYKAMAQVCYDYADFLHIDPSWDIPCSAYIDIASPTQLSNSLTNEFVVNSIVNGVTRAQFDAFVSDWRAQCGNQLSTIYNNWYKNRK